MDFTDDIVLLAKWEDDLKVILEIVNSKLSVKRNVKSKKFMYA